MSNLRVSHDDLDHPRGPDRTGAAEPERPESAFGYDQGQLRSYPRQLLTRHAVPGMAVEIDATAAH